MEMQKIARFVFEGHLLDEAVSFSLPPVISTILIIHPRAASSLIQPETLMEHNEPHSCLLDAKQELCSHRVAVPQYYTKLKKKKKKKRCLGCDVLYCY